VPLLYVTSSAIILGFVLLGFIANSNRRQETPQNDKAAKPPALAKK